MGAGWLRGLSGASAMRRSICISIVFYGISAGNNSIEIGESTTFFCKMKNIQIDEQLEWADMFDVNLTKLDPVIYSGAYHSIGNLLGKIGDFSK